MNRSIFGTFSGLDLTALRVREVHMIAEMILIDMPAAIFTGESRVIARIAIERTTHGELFQPGTILQSKFTRVIGKELTVTAAGTGM